jgi:hypothetical protein
MDISTVTAFIVALILILIINCTDDGIPLLLIGFGTAAFTWNLDSIFSITSSVLNGWGIVIIWEYWITAVFAFGKAGVAGYDHGIFKTKRTHE